MSDTPIIEADPYLGQVIAHYPSDRLRPLIVAAAVGVPILAALYFTLAAVPDWWGPLLTILITGIAGSILGWYVLHHWNREIILYERGFTYREGSRTVQFLYEEVRGLRLRAERLAYFGGLLRRNVYRFTVITIRDERFIITNLYRRAAELGSRLSERINRVLAPTLARKLMNGEAIPFSDTLRLSARGLHEGGRDLPWANFGGYQVGGRRLMVRTASGEMWYSAPLSEVDNITLLIDLLQQRSDARQNA